MGMEVMPDVEDFAYRSERITIAFSYDRSDNRELYDQFAKASEKLSSQIHALSPSANEEDQVSFFKRRVSVGTALEESLWKSFRDYREAIDKILGIVLPQRKEYYKRYLKMVAIERESGRTLSREQKKSLQASLDSVTTLPQVTYRISVDERERLADFVNYFQFKSDPAEELAMTNLLAKVDDLFAAKGKMMLYQKLISLESLSEAEKSQLYHFSVLLKSKTDYQFEQVAR